MNNLQPNERHLADKLRNVPAPDVDRSWEQMKQLLDREMPEGAAGWSGNRKWWWMGITAGVIMLAVWLTQQLSSHTDERLTSTEAVKTIAPSQENPAKSIASADNNKTTSVTDKTITQKITGPKDNNIPSSENTNSTSSDNKQFQETATEHKPVNSEINKNTTIANKDQSPGTVKNKPVPGDQEHYAGQASTREREPNSVVSRPDRQNADVVSKGLEAKDESASGDKNPGNVTGRNKGNLTSAQKDILQDKSSEIKEVSGINDINTQIAPPASTISVEEEKVISHANDAAIGRETLAGPAMVFNTAEINSTDAMAIAGKTDRVFAREQRKKSIKEDDRRMSRSSMRGNYGEKEHEITFAAGLTIPQGFAVGNQQASRYNVSAGTSRLPDYLPAPFFQYHINPKLFLQTELHFQSPQYTQRLLLSRTSVTGFPTISENNVYLEKLYYFNVPFNVYYSPARNFFIGGGLQYSSLLSGVASYEERRITGQTQSYNTVTRRFKDDSVAAKFAPSEWRYQFDANYYFRRFTLGVRYNQAMRDFIDLQATTLRPAVQGRNRAFLLYLRFNIWEERKKTND